MHRCVSPAGVFAVVVTLAVVALLLVSSVAAGTLDDGADLLPQAGISMDEAIAEAQAAATGSVGEVDLEYVGDVLVFNVEVGTRDVKVDATSGAVLSLDA
jgi:uncharacterized membrane protein YkoI